MRRFGFLSPSQLVAPKRLSFAMFQDVIAVVFSDEPKSLFFFCADGGRRCFRFRAQELASQYESVVKEKKSATAELQSGVEQFRSKAKKTLTSLLGQFARS